ncbi:MAG: VOC family protein [Rhizobium sp.]|nr:VOC family protein [Rhizobium sp.]
MSSDHDLSRRAVLQFVATGTIAMSLATFAPSVEAASFAVTRPIHIRSVSLKVRDLPVMTAFYNQIMGMDVLSRSEGESALGQDGQVLLTLKARPAGEPDDGRSAGLFHTAFLMPDRASLGRWLIFAAKNSVPFTGFSDHLVSEALYLDDPEGNGIEVYADRAPETWRWNGDQIAMATERLDIDNLVAGLPGDATMPFVAPEGFRIGHVHLRVGDTARAEDFYVGTAGLDMMAKIGDASAIFLANGRYHHHVGANVWRSRGAGLRNEAMNGLDDLAFNVSEPLMDGLRRRLIAAGSDFHEVGDTIEALDPWGTRVKFVSAA